MSKTKQVPVSDDDDSTSDEEENDNKRIPRKTTRIAKVEKKKYGSKCVICNSEFSRSDGLAQHYGTNGHIKRVNEFVKNVLSGNEITGAQAHREIADLKDEISELKDKLCKAYKTISELQSKNRKHN